MRRLIAILLFGALAGTAWAQLPMHMPPLGTPSSGHKGPGDTVTLNGFYSTRAYNAAASAAHVKMWNMIRASDSHTCDMLASSVTGGPGVTGNCSTGGDNGSTLSAWLNATTGKVVKWYDQISDNCDAIQNTGTNQASITVSLINSLPGFVFAGNQNYVSSGCSTTAPIGPYGNSFPFGEVFVAKRTSAFTTRASTFSSNGNGSQFCHFGFESSANTGFVGCGTAQTFTMSDSAWHAVNINVAVTTDVATVNVDGTVTTTSSVGGSGPAGNANIGNDNQGNPLTGQLVEVAWRNPGLSNANLTALCQNQQAYWGAGNFAATC